MKKFLAVLGMLLFLSACGIAEGSTLPTVGNREETTTTAQVTKGEPEKELTEETAGQSETAVTTIAEISLNKQEISGSSRAMKKPLEGELRARGKYVFEREYLPGELAINQNYLEFLTDDRGELVLPMEQVRLVVQASEGDAPGTVLITFNTSSETVGFILEKEFARTLSDYFYMVKAQA